jgi:drug/metabolite transporter (DMT)-like permease
MAVSISVKWKIVIAFFCVYVFWGMTYLAMRVAVVEIPPHLMAGSRFVLAGSLLYIWTRYRGAARPTLKQWWTATVIGAFLLLGGNASVAWAEQRIPSGLAAVLIGVVPIWMVGIEWARSGSRPAKRVIGGLMLGVIGVGLLVSPQAGSRSEVDLLGAAIVVLASASWAWGSVFSKSAPLPSSPFLATSMEMLSGGIIILAVAAVAGQFHDFHPAAISGPAAAAWLFLVVFGSLIAFTAYIWLLRVTSIAKVGTYAYVNPIVAVLLGWAVLGEPVTLRTIIATLVILLGVALVNVDWASLGLLDRLPARLRPTRAS